jgi:hypothetical protein
MISRKTIAPEGWLPEGDGTIDDGPGGHGSRSITSYRTKFTVASLVTRQQGRVGAFMPTLLAPGESDHYRRVIICRAGRTQRRLVQRVNEVTPDSRRTLILLGSGAWFAPFATDDAVAFCCESLNGVGNYAAFNRALKWLRNQGRVRPASTLELLNREAERLGLSPQKLGRLDS